MFNFAKRWRRNEHQKNKGFAHFVLAFCLGVIPPAYADTPAPISKDDFHSFDPAKAKIGQLLFYDKILSGNRNISCGTCHHHDLGSGDELSLGIGEGGQGIGQKRTAGVGRDQIKKRIPRNAPGLWNLGHKDVSVMFHDGRLTVSDIYGNGFNSPAEEWLPQGLETILAAQALFPLVAQFEMAGNPSENDVAGAVHDRIDAAWPIIAKRVWSIPEYGSLFVAAFANVTTPADVSIVEIANALAAFMGLEWQSHDSPYDMWRTGSGDLTGDASAGMDLFFGTAKCSACHSGPLFSDQKFHALALPAFGPGRTRGFDPMARDVGRMGETDRLEDAYRFRTPSLRNVALTSPYGHNGAFATLDSIIRHHSDPVASLTEWTAEMANLPSVPWLQEIDFVVQADQRELDRQRRHIDIEPVALSEIEITQLTAFLNSLTGISSSNTPYGRPDTVPSGLQVD